MEIANVEAAEAWDGHEGEHWAANTDRYERSSVRHRPHLISSAIISAGDHVLDIGCGAGLTTLEASRLASDGTAIGIDLSSRMLARAKDRAASEGVGNVTFVQGDAQVHPFEPGAADVAISLYGSMFFGDPVAAFTQHRPWPAAGRTARAADVARARPQRVDHHGPRRPRARARPPHTPAGRSDTVLAG